MSYARVRFFLPVLSLCLCIGCSDNNANNSNNTSTDASVDLKVDGSVDPDGTVDDERADVVEDTQKDEEVREDPCESAVGATCDNFFKDYIKSSNSRSGDRFGTSLSLDGDRMAIGANLADVAADGVTYQGAGAVYIFERTNGQWEEKAILTASNPGEEDSFGSSLDLEGDEIIIGAINESSANQDTPEDDSLEGSGAVYVFTRDAQGQWSQSQYIKSPRPSYDSDFGINVRRSGDYLAVSAPFEAYNADGTSITGPISNDASLYSSVYAGSAYIYKKETTGWTLLQTLSVPAEDFSAEDKGWNDFFGTALDLEGTRLVVTAPNSGAGLTEEDFPGRGYIYELENDLWVRKSIIEPSNGAISDDFGNSAVLDGDTIIIGAPYESSTPGNPDSNDRTESGAAYVFVKDGEGWTQQAILKASNASDNAQFTNDIAGGISLDGDIAVIGARLEEGSGTGVNPDFGNGGVLESGAAYIFKRTGTTWTQLAYLKSPYPGEDDRFGHDVLLDGTTLIISAYREASAGKGINQNGQLDNSARNTGAVFTYELPR